MPLGMIGAPTVGVEKLPCGDEGERLRDHLEESPAAVWSR